MGKRHYYLLIMLALISGFAGGVLSNWFLMGQPAYAEKTEEIPKVIKAQSFQAVDHMGKVRLELGGKWGTLVYYDAHGKAQPYYKKEDINKIFGK